MIGWVEFLDRPPRDEVGQGTPDPEPQAEPALEAAEPELALVA